MANLAAAEALAGALAALRDLDGALLPEIWSDHVRPFLDAASLLRLSAANGALLGLTADCGLVLWLSPGKSPARMMLPTARAPPRPPRDEPWRCRSRLT